MKTKTYYKHLMMLFLLALFALITQDAIGQNFVNKSTGTVINAGVIKLTVNNAEFQNDAPATTNAAPVITNTSGTIEFNAVTNTFTGLAPIGVVDISRIDGWIRYSNNAGGNQNIQGRSWLILD